MVRQFWVYATNFAALGHLGVVAEQEALPLDADAVAEVFGHVVEADRPDVAPRSEEVRPDGQRYRRWTWRSP